MDVVPGTRRALAIAGVPLVGTRSAGELHCAGGKPFVQAVQETEIARRRERSESAFDTFP